MLSRLSTAPATSEALELPLRSRLTVTSFMPKAARNRNGNSTASKASEARSETASSISTAFIAKGLSAAELFAYRGF